MDRKRYHFIDNIRWVVVLLVLLYHVFYNYNALGVFGAIGSLGDNQWQDIICTLYYDYKCCEKKANKQIIFDQMRDNGDELAK